MSQRSKLIGIERPQGTIDLNTVPSAVRQLEVIDPHMVECIEFRVLLKVMSVESLTSGGVFKPETAIEKELFGKCTAEVVSIGDEAFTDSAGVPLKKRPKAGDTVVIAKYAGITVRDKDYNLYRFANDKDIVGIIKGGKA